MITEALILAGGKGTRLSKVLKGNPKQEIWFWKPRDPKPLMSNDTSH